MGKRSKEKGKPALTVVPEVETLAEPLVIEMLEEVLEMARNGKVAAVGVTMVYRDLTTSNSFVWGMTPYSMLVGATSRMLHRMNIEMDEVMDSEGD